MPIPDEIVWECLHDSCVELDHLAADLFLSEFHKSFLGLGGSFACKERVRGISLSMVSSPMTISQPQSISRSRGSSAWHPCERAQAYWIAWICWPCVGSPARSDRKRLKRKPPVGPDSNGRHAWCGLAWIDRIDQPITRSVVDQLLATGPDDLVVSGVISMIFGSIVNPRTFSGAAME